MAGKQRLVFQSVPLPGDWAERAACRGWGPENFFRPRGSVITLRVKKLCGACPVQPECLEYGVRYKLLGIWGGLATHERRQLRLRRQKVA